MSEWESANHIFLRQGTYDVHFLLRLASMKITQGLAEMFSLSGFALRPCQFPAFARQHLRIPIDVHLVAEPDHEPD